MCSVLNTLSEYTYFYMSKNITSYHFCCLFLKASKAFSVSLKEITPFTIHQRVIPSIAIELFKVKRNLLNNIMYDIFQTRKINYNLRSQTDFASNCENTNKFGLNSLRYFASNK